MPGHLWEQLAPKHLEWVRQHAPPMRTSERKTLKILVERLECDGRVRWCAPGLRPARAYVKPKSSEKCSLIVDPRNVNELCAETSGPPQLFRLGHLDQLAALLEVAVLAGQEVSFVCFLQHVCFHFQTQAKKQIKAKNRFSTLQMGGLGMGAGS